ncbi:hypothetical protein BD770DRAFT_473665 [Pilaira anomala]|nr:hypothetical protein BD770DRAFT_473665 [Pilaira anomala]
MNAIILSDNVTFSIVNRTTTVASTSNIVWDGVDEREFGHELNNDEVDDDDNDINDADNDDLDDDDSSDEDDFDEEDVNDD